MSAHPGDAPHELDSIRARSKLVFGARYRAEVAAALGSFEKRPWTTAELTNCLRENEIPTSSINQELHVLLKAGYIKRHHRTNSGHYLYSTEGPAEYWAAATAALLSEAQVTTDNAPVPIRDGTRRG